MPDKWEYYIDRLSVHIASSGKQYKSHAATVYKWAQEDIQKTVPKKGIPDYSYSGEDGLLYCGKCHKPKEAYFPKDKMLFGIDRHPAECDCRRAEREKREKEETAKKHNDEVERLKRNGFTDSSMREWTFENDNGNCPQIGNAHFYVEHWEAMKSENIGYLLWGECGYWEKLFCGLYRKCPYGKGDTCPHDELCGDTE